MNQSIAEKIKLFTDLKDKTQIYKVIPTLLMISTENIKTNMDVLSEIGITIKHIYEIKICALDYEVLRKRVSYIKDNNIQNKYQENPLLIMDSREFKEPVVELPTIPESIVAELNAGKEDEDELTKTAILKEIELNSINEPQVDHLDKLLNDDLNFVSLVDGDDPLDDEKKDEVIEETGKDTLKELIEEPALESKEESNSKEAELEEIANIINNTTLTITSDNFERYQRLSDVVNKVIENINDSNLVKENNIYEILSKLVAYNYGDDFDIVYISLTYQKELSKELLSTITKQINEVINKKEGE